jgi:hypothetical protein
MSPRFAAPTGQDAAISQRARSPELFSRDRTPMLMRFLFGIALAFSVVALRAEIHPLLDEAWTQYVADIDHWAYTETTRALDAKGRVTRETATRYDPSKAYPEQFTVLSHTGKTPLAQMETWARQRGLNRGKSLERPGGVEHDAKPRIILNGSPLLADLEHATVVADTSETVTFEIPLRAEAGKGSSAEKFRTRVRVSKTHRAFEHVSMQLPAPMRISPMVKLRESEISIDFTSVDPKFSPTPTLFKDRLLVSAFFIKREGGHESVRSDFKRVKPYRDRFRVEIGPSRTIDF